MNMDPKLPTKEDEQTEQGTQEREGADQPGGTELPAEGEGNGGEEKE